MMDLERRQPIEEACYKITCDAMKRNAPYLAYLITKSEIKESAKFEFLDGFSEGFTLALYMIITGQMDLEVIQREIPD